MRIGFILLRIGCKHTNNISGFTRGRQFVLLAEGLLASHGGIFTCCGVTPVNPPMFGMSVFLSLAGHRVASHVTPCSRCGSRKSERLQ